MTADDKDVLAQNNALRQHLEETRRRVQNQRRPVARPIGSNNQRSVPLNPNSPLHRELQQHVTYFSDGS